MGRNPVVDFIHIFLLYLGGLTGFRVMTLEELLLLIGVLELFFVDSDVGLHVLVVRKFII